MRRMEDGRQSQSAVIKQLLRETLTLLCKNTLIFNTELSIEGLLGLTVDKNEIILVSIGETISKNANDLGEMLEPCQMARYSPMQGRLKGKKKRPSRGTEGSVFCNGQPRADRSTGHLGALGENSGLLAESVKSKSEAMTIEVDFDFERIEVKEEPGMESGSYVGYDGGGGGGGGLPLEDNRRPANALPQNADYDDDCFLVEPMSSVVATQCAGSGSQTNLRDVQSPHDLKVFDPSVDSFMSVDQEIFREMFQADFATNALSYDVEGGCVGAQDLQDASGSQSRRRIQRRRPNFTKTDGGGAVGLSFPRTSGIHRRGYRFHCRYGYSSRILHQCTQCSATFTMSSNLGRHMSTMHNLNGDGQCVYCPVCQKQFSRSDNLARHLKQVHKHPSSAAAAAAQHVSTDDLLCSVASCDP